jgi:signal transduction histidine kinase
MTATIDSLSGAVRATEEAAQARFDEAVQGVYARVGMAGLGFMAASILFGIATARSIGQPLQDLQATMQNIVDGLYDRRVSGLEARDEIGAMARAVEVFRKNAVDKQQAQQDLRTAKDRAEAALTELREAQQNLIEAEKLAALGSLVAGVAHEINNPVGISLTVASSLAGRCETFATELQAGPLRRSHLFEFVEGNREAARQLVANLNRAGELVHSFKQVAVDRTHAERRTFDLKEASDQIAASLRPGARQCQVALEVGIPKGMIMDSYPGPYGQVLTNLFLNALTHAFKPGQGGTVRISARTLDEAHVEILFEDKGQGMSAEVFRRAFEPFLRPAAAKVVRGSASTSSTTSSPGASVGASLLIPARAMGLGFASSYLLWRRGTTLCSRPKAPSSTRDGRE